MIYHCFVERLTPFTACNRTYSSFSGRITSPGWPGSYPAHSHCEFLVQSPEGTDLALYFNMFNTEQDIRGCRYDYLQVTPTYKYYSISLGFFLNSIYNMHIPV